MTLFCKSPHLCKRFPPNLLPAVSTGRSLERLESRGSCKVTELDDLAPFLVEEGEEEAMGLTPIPSEREEEGAAGTAENGAAGEQLQTPVHTAGSVHEDSILGTVEEGEEEAMGLTPIPSEREEEGAAGPAENGASGEAQHLKTWDLLCVLLEACTSTTFWVAKVGEEGMLPLVLTQLFMLAKPPQLLLLLLCFTAWCRASRVRRH